MKRLARVLAAIDCSEPARRAFAYALALSQQHDAELVAVHAVPRHDSPNWQVAQRRQLIAELRDEAEQAQVPFRSLVQPGDAADLILLHARSLRADLIVAGAHQRRGFARLRSASVGAQLVAAAEVPVLLVPRAGLARPAGHFTHVAVAVDFDASSDAAVAHALSLATTTGQRVTLLHVVPGADPGEPSASHALGIVNYQEQLMREDRATLMRAARIRLLLALAGQRPTAATVDTRVVAGHIPTAISHAVNRIGADVLVVGVRSRGAVARALFGSTAAALLRVSPVPLLAVPQASTAPAREASGSLQLAF